MDDYSGANLYDKVLFPFVYPLRRKILKIVKTKKYKSILDVCCGTGNQLKILQKKGFNGVGVDLSEDMLSVALNGKNSVNCKLEDAANISYPDKSFDMVMTTFALHEKEPAVAKKIFDEMLRLVKDGGDIIISDFNVSPDVFKVASKIIDFIESKAGEEHYANFCKYRELGGLNYLLKEYNFKNITKHLLWFSGVLVVVITR